MKYREIHRSYQKHGKGWVRFDEDDFGIVEQKNVDLATSYDTRKFFKSIGSKESISKETDGSVVIDSLSPDKQFRTIIRFEVIKEG